MRPLIVVALVAATSQLSLAQAEDTTTSRRWYTAGIGGAAGHFGAPYNRHGYAAGSASLAWQIQHEPGIGMTTKLTFFRGDLQPGTYRACGACRWAGGNASNTLSGYVLTHTFDWKYVGLTMGVVGGTFGVGEQQLVANPNGIAAVQAKVSSALRVNYPALGMRVGPLTGLFVDAGAFAADPAGVPTPSLTFGIGLGSETGARRFRVGVSDLGYYASSTFSFGSAYDAALRLSGDDTQRGLSGSISRRFRDRTSVDIQPLVTVSHQHPVLDRLDYFMFRGAILGGLVGPVVGLSQPQTDASKSPHIGESMMIGVGTGLVAGALVGAVSRYHAPPAAATLKTPRATRRDDFFRHVWFGGRLGFGSGILVALENRRQLGAGRDRNAIFAGQVLAGTGVGLLGGALMYLVHP